MAIDIDVQIGINLRKAREARRLNQKDLAKMLGVEYQVLSRYENGKGGLSTARIKQIAKALDIPESVLLNLDDESTIQPPTDQEIINRIQLGLAALNGSIIPPSTLEKFAKLDKSSRKTAIDAFDITVDTLLGESDEAIDDEEVG